MRISKSGECGRLQLGRLEWWCARFGGCCWDCVFGVSLVRLLRIIV